MSTGTITSTFSLCGLQFGSQATRTGDGAISLDPTLDAGKAGTLSTRTDDDTGVATLSEGHGVTDSDTVDVYWSGGLRYGMSVTLVDGNDVSIDEGSGDVLPDEDTAIIVGVRQQLNATFDGDDVEMFAFLCDKRAHVELTESDDTSIKPWELLGNEAWQWVKDTGVTNPLTGNPVAKIQASCGETKAGQLYVSVLYDSTP